MREAGFEPVGQVYNTNYWRREEVLSMAAALPKRAPRPAGGQAALALRFRELVDVNFRDALPLKDYADMLGVTTERLYAACTSVAGKSPLKLIHERIFEEARSLLAGSKAPISEISNSLGFTYPAHFAKFFAKAAGSSPRTFRKQVEGAF
jgi:AraC-like DNA-binding protein